MTEAHTAPSADEMGGWIDVTRRKPLLTKAQRAPNAFGPVTMDEQHIAAWRQKRELHR